VFSRTGWENFGWKRIGTPRRSRTFPTSPCKARGNHLLGDLQARRCRLRRSLDGHAQSHCRSFRSPDGNSVCSVEKIFLSGCLCLISVARLGRSAWPVSNADRFRCEIFPKSRGLFTASVAFSWRKSCERFPFWARGPQPFGFARP